MKVARCAAIAGAAGTSNVAAAMRYGLEPVGTMAHSYVMSFNSESESFRAFMEDTPENAVILVDTYDTLKGVRNAIVASETTGVPLKGVRLDSGDLLALSRAARELLDGAGMTEAHIVASGDLEERQIAELVAAGAPIDVWGVGTDLGTSRDSPALGGVYKLVADMPEPGEWRPVFKRSPAKATIPGPKQVFRTYRDDEMSGDLIAASDERPGGSPLLRPVMRSGSRIHSEALSALSARAAAQLDALPERLRLPAPAAEPEPYPIAYSERLMALAAFIRRESPPSLRAARHPGSGSRSSSLRKGTVISARTP
jgi:nicotinate phosphoribosyltransferase